MKRSSYRCYDSWTGSMPNTVSRSAYRKTTEMDESNFNSIVSQFMMTGLGKFSFAICLGILVAIVYALIFGLSFVQYFFFTILFTAVSVGVSAFSRG